LDYPERRKLQSRQLNRLTKRLAKRCADYFEQEGYGRDLLSAANAGHDLRAFLMHVRPQQVVLVVEAEMLEAGVSVLGNEKHSINGFIVINPTHSAPASLLRGSATPLSDADESGTMNLQDFVAKRRKPVPITEEENSAISIGIGELDLAFLEVLAERSTPFQSKLEVAREQALGENFSPLAVLAYENRIKMHDAAMNVLMAASLNSAPYGQSDRSSINYAYHWPISAMKYTSAGGEDLEISRDDLPVLIVDREYALNTAKDQLNSFFSPDTQLRYATTSNNGRDVLTDASADIIDFVRQSVVPLSGGETP
jgi:hypothetical protein